MLAITLLMVQLPPVRRYIMYICARILEAGAVTLQLCWQWHAEKLGALIWLSRM
jgi:hypothetical protein